MGELTLLFPLAVALAAAPVTALTGALRPQWAGFAAIAMSGLAFGATLWGWLQGGGTIDLPWAPAWGLRLSFSLDGLAALYALLATGVGFLVSIYSVPYIRHHLEEEGRPEREEARFFTLLMLFLGAMVGLVLAQDLMLLFVFWDLTAVASWLLIGFDREKEEAREAALLALLVTGVSAVCLLLGAMILYGRHETFDIPVLLARAEPAPWLAVAAGLIAIAALAKSAQVPIHLWLPRAMTAPSPVSAYLHSAAMVAAGVFLLQRIHPLIALSSTLRQGLVAVGLASMAVGGLFALVADPMKQVLAWSTVAQYGYVVALLGLGGEAGVAAAVFYVLAHGLFKSALFLTAGAVTQATGEHALSGLGGLARSMPLLAGASGIAAAALSAVPFTIGYFKDELFFKAAAEHGPLLTGAAVVGAGLSVAYIWRFWGGIFLGPRLGPPGPQAEPRKISPALILPVAVLAGLVLAGGLVPGPFARLAEEAGHVVHRARAPIDAAYHFDGRAENWMALASFGLGVLLLVSRRLWHRPLAALTGLGSRVGPQRWHDVGRGLLHALSDLLYFKEIGDLHGRISMILVPAALLVAAGLALTPLADTYRLSPVVLADLPLICALLLAVTTALLAALRRDHLTMVLALSCMGYCLAAVYAFVGGPDVALVAVLVETIFTLLLLGFLDLFPRGALNRQVRQSTPRRRRLRDPLIGTVAGLFAFAVSWGAFSQPAPAADSGMAAGQIVRTESAHAKDVVTAILADFRGLDTLGEISVVAVAALAVAALLRRKERAG